MMRSVRIALAQSISIALVVVSGGGCAPDAEHDAQVSALGGEAPGVPRGPLHRAGQPCLVCHGGSGPASAQFSIGGTIYGLKDMTDPIAGATVSITDKNESVHTATTNAAGNFYTLLSEWQPQEPMHDITVSVGTITASMTTRIGRSGSCATCHYDPASHESVGHVYVAADPSDLPGGTP